MEKIQFFVLWFVPFLFSLSFHEAAHAWTANRFGDPTAKFMGRLTLNPLAHADLFGTILIPILVTFAGIPFIGYAKPVPVNSRNLKGRWSDFLVSAAGPISNMILAVGFTILLFLIKHLFGSGITLLSSMEGSVFTPLFQMFVYAVHTNIALALFNLFPFPPLDGARMLSELFPPFQEVLALIDRAGFMASYLLLYLAYQSGIITKVIFLPASKLTDLLLGWAL